MSASPRAGFCIKISNNLPIVASMRGNVRINVDGSQSILGMLRMPAADPIIVSAPSIVRMWYIDEVDGRDDLRGAVARTIADRKSS